MSCRTVTDTLATGACRKGTKICYFDRFCWSQGSSAAPSEGIFWFAWPLLDDHKVFLILPGAQLLRKLWLGAFARGTPSAPFSCLASASRTIWRLAKIQYKVLPSTSSTRGILVEITSLLDVFDVSWKPVVLMDVCCSQTWTPLPGSAFFMGLPCFILLLRTHRTLAFHYGGPHTAFGVVSSWPPAILLSFFSSLYPLTPCRASFLRGKGVFRDKVFSL